MPIITYTVLNPTFLLFFKTQRGPKDTYIYLVTSPVICHLILLNI